MAIVDRLRSGAATTPPADIPRSTLCFLLKEDRRVAVVRLLNAGESTRAELADDIAAAEKDAPVYSDKRKAVYISLHQSHLPKLEKHDVVEVDRDGSVRAGRNHAAALAAIDALAPLTADAEGGAEA